MSIDTNRLVQIAAELNELEGRRERLLAELQRVAWGSSSAVSISPRRRGRPPGSRNKSKAATPAVGGRKRRKGLTTDILGLLADGGSHTAGDIVAKLKLPPTKSKTSSVSTTLVRLVKDGRVKKDAKRGYRAA